MSGEATHSKAVREAARRIRGRVIQMSHHARAAHLGSSLSCVDVLAVVYLAEANVSPATIGSDSRDRVILSKGHAAMALYATLAESGFIEEGLLERFGDDGAELSEQMSPGCASGVEAATGSLGHGLSLGVGMALTSKIRNVPYHVWVVMSDGECNEGSVWEAAMFAAAQKLDNLTVAIDFNGWQATGRSRDVLALDPLKDKWAAFGFDAVDVPDGHDIDALRAALGQSPASGKPRAVIAHTVKGKGVSFMEDDNNWHYRIPNAEEVAAAFVELGLPT